MDLTVIIPTRDRPAVLRESVTRLEHQSDAVAVEVIIVDDGSGDECREAMKALVAGSRLDIALMEQAPSGPAAARNRAIATARAKVCLFLNDDSLARPGLLLRHRDFHLRNPDQTAALLGSLVLPPDPPPTAFMEWFGDALFDYASIDDPTDAGGQRFFTANVSAKTELLRTSEGFDESYPSAAFEDLDLGLRLEQQGMRLAYDPLAAVDHAHPIDLAGAISRLTRQGVAMAPFAEHHPEWPVPRRPGLRHRVKAGALTGLAATGLRSGGIQREIWRFLCHEATREGYWSEVEHGRFGNGRPLDGLQIGARLARLATRDVEAQIPAAYVDEA